LPKKCVAAMLYRSMGSIILVMTAVFFSWQKMRHNRIQKQIIIELTDYLRHIYRNIECYRKPLPEITAEYTGKLLREVGFCTKIENGDFFAAVECLKDYIPQDIYAVIGNYGKSAGKGYSEDELRICRNTCEILEEAVQKMDKDSKKQNRIIQTLPLIFALSAVLLFW